MSGAETEQSQSHSQFSLFEGDLVNRVFAKFHIGGRHPLHIFARMVFVIAVSWVPMALLATLTPLPPNPVPSELFFYDFAAYAQFLIGIPLFILAERVVGTNTLEAARDFAESGIISAAEKPRLAAIERKLAALRRKLLPDLICILVAMALAYMTIGPELVLKTGMKTWHTTLSPGGQAQLTPAGAWEMFVALPIQIYWWVRWVWKIALWYWYLAQVSRLRLVLVASHPDHTGGIAFLSEVQAKFSLVILAYGISNVVATVGYKLAVEHAPVTLPPVWGPVLGFIVLAPILFLAPLLLFTKQLHRTKKRAIALFRAKAMTAALTVETAWLKTDTDQTQEAVARQELAQLNLLTAFHERIHGMRVVPFDIRSAGELIGSAVGPMLPLLPYFVTLPEPWQKILEAITKWLPH